MCASAHLPSRRLPSPTIRHRHLTQIIRVDPLKAADIETKLMRIGAASVMGVDSAVTAEKMLSHLLTLASNHCQVSRRHRRNDCASALADRAVAAVGRGQAIGQVDFEDNGAAMATGTMVAADQRVTDLFEHD